jgi:transposase InsO family protein
VSRISVHAWLRRYLAGGLAGLVDRSHRPRSCPHQVSDSVAVLVAEVRRQHPRWGAKRIRMELLRKPPEGVVIPSTATVNRILVRHGLVNQRKRKRRRDSYVRWQRPAAMQLWQLDIVGGVMLVDPVTGVLREAKVVTGVDDHSRFCVIASVVERATARAVCLALAAALSRFGVPEEILTDNGKQFTDRFGKGGEVLFDKICRQNAITHRLTQPVSGPMLSSPNCPTTTGKIERFHLTLRRELLDDHQRFQSVEAAQAAVDGFVEQYNADRPHQGLDPDRPVTPAERFSAIPEERRKLLPVWVPPTLTAAATPVGGSAKDADEDGTANAETSQPAVEGWVGGPVEFDRVVPPSGNMQLAGKQFWLGPSRAGQVVRFWASVDLIHLLVGSVKIKTVRSHLTVNDLARLVIQGAANAGPSPLPPIEHGAAVEVDRVVSRGGTVCIGGKILLAAEILAGRQVGIRIEPDTLMFFDLQTRELLRVRPNPLSVTQVARLRGNRPAGPPPRPSLEPVRVQRRASNSGVIMVCGQKIALGRLHRWQTVTIAVSETTLAIELPDQEPKIVRRTTTTAVRNIKAARPRPGTSQVV